MNTAHICLSAARASPLGSASQVQIWIRGSEWVLVKIEERMHEATLRLQPRKTSLSKSWDGIMCSCSRFGEAWDETGISLCSGRADTHRMQYLSCRLVVDGLVLKKQPGILFETGGCRRATSAKSNGFVKPFRGFMCKPTSCKLSTTVWPTLHMRQDKQSPLVGQTRTDCSWDRVA